MAGGLASRSWGALWGWPGRAPLRGGAARRWRQVAGVGLAARGRRWARCGRGDTWPIGTERVGRLRAGSGRRVGGVSRRRSAAALGPGAAPIPRRGRGADRGRAGRRRAPVRGPGPSPAAGRGPQRQAGARPAAAALRGHQHRRAEFGEDPANDAADHPLGKARVLAGACRRQARARFGELDIVGRAGAIALEIPGQFGGGDGHGGAAVGQRRGDRCGRRVDTRGGGAAGVVGQHRGRAGFALARHRRGVARGGLGPRQAGPDDENGPDRRGAAPLDAIRCRAGGADPRAALSRARRARRAAVRRGLRPVSERRGGRRRGTRGRGPSIVSCGRSIDRGGKGRLDPCQAAGGGRGG